MRYRFVAPAVDPLPPHWKEIPPPFPIPIPGAQRAFRTRHCTLIMDCSEKDDGRLWLHVSVARRDRVPSYDELCEVKRLFIGENRIAIHVWPTADKHVSIHPNCLHLWSPVEANPLPEFSFRGLTI